jgi:hypothetical protein
MSLEIAIVMQTISATSAWACGLFMIRFWRETHDRLFALFGLAFWLMALSWILLAILDPTDDARPYVYVIRLFAFMLIIAAIVGKNRGEVRGRSQSHVDPP